MWGGLEGLGGSHSVPTRLQLLTSEWRTDAQDGGRNFLSCLTKTSEQRALVMDMCVSVCVCVQFFFLFIHLFDHLLISSDRLL